MTEVTRMLSGMYMESLEVDKVDRWFLGRFFGHLSKAGDCLCVDNIIFC